MAFRAWLDLKFVCAVRMRSPAITIQMRFLRSKLRANAVRSRDIFGSYKWKTPPFRNTGGVFHIGLFLLCIATWGFARNRKKGFVEIGRAWKAATFCDLKLADVFAFQNLNGSFHSFDIDIFPKGDPVQLFKDIWKIGGRETSDPCELFKCQLSLDIALNIVDRHLDALRQVICCF